MPGPGSDDDEPGPGDVIPGDPSIPDHGLGTGLPRAEPGTPRLGADEVRSMRVGARGPDFSGRYLVKSQ